MRNRPIKWGGFFVRNAGLGILALLVGANNRVNNFSTHFIIFFGVFRHNARHDCDGMDDLAHSPYGLARC